MGTFYSHSQLVFKLTFLVKQKTAFVSFKPAKGFT